MKHRFRIPKTTLFAAFLGLAAAVFGAIGSAQAGHGHVYAQNPHRSDARLLAQQPKPNGVTDAAITPISVRGPDRLVWLIYGEGFTEAEQTTKYVGYLHKTFDHWMAQEPLSRFVDEINVYAVNTLSKTAWNGTASQDTYFDIRHRANNEFPELNNNNSEAESKLNAIKRQIVSNYLDPGATVIEQTILVNSLAKDSFRAYHMGGYALVSNAYYPTYTGNTIVHEAGHAFGLEDEYGYANNYASKNAAWSPQVAENSWGAFYGYQWHANWNNNPATATIGAHKETGTADRIDRYIPYDSRLAHCMMLDVYSPGLEFCPVCRYYMFDFLNKKTGHAHDWFWLEPNVSFDAQANKIRFHTVYRNYTDGPRRVRVEIGSAADRDGIYVSEPIEAKADGKPAKLEIAGEAPSLASAADFEWKIVDDQTNETILGSPRRTAKIDLRFVDEQGNPLPQSAIRPYSVAAPMDEAYRIVLPEIDGYAYAGTEDELTIQRPIADQVVKLRFAKVPSKELTLRLLDEDGKTTLRERKATVYENGMFVPSQNDFIINNGVGYVAAAKTGALAYGDIDESNGVVEYQKTLIPRVEVLAKDVYVAGGEHPNGYRDLVKEHALSGALQWTNAIYGMGIWNPDPDVQAYEEMMIDLFDWNKPGHYELTVTLMNYFVDYSVDALVTVEVEESVRFSVIGADGTVPPWVAKDDAQPSQPSQPNPQNPPNPPGTGSGSQQGGNSGQDGTVDPPASGSAGQGSDPNAGQQQGSGSKASELAEKLTQLNQNPKKSREEYQQILDIESQVESLPSGERTEFENECSQRGLNATDLFAEAHRFMDAQTGANADYWWFAAIVPVAAATAGICWYAVSRKKKKGLNA